MTVCKSVIVQFDADETKTLSNAMEVCRVLLRDYGLSRMDGNPLNSLTEAERHQLSRLVYAFFESV